MNLEDAVQSVLDYHRKTNHSVESVRAGNISLDFSILPRLYKLYRRAETVPLPEESAPSNVPALEAIAGDAPTRDDAPTLEDVAALLKLSAASPSGSRCPTARWPFERRPAPARSTTSSCTWCAATCRACPRASTSTARRTTRFVVCGRATIEVRS